LEEPAAIHVLITWLVFRFPSSPCYPVPARAFKERVGTREGHGLLTA